ncbi:MAG: hypothetical protein JWO64_3132 [Hyphomicrobiales bacterium]|jgi:hypothetical protein|nr:hypothetical protein [Hyphomicrobiales bacterium]
MLKKLIFTLSALIVGSAFSPARAQTVTFTTPDVGTIYIRSTLQTVFSFGVQWDFGDNRPDFVAGIRRTQTNTTSHVIGSKVDLAFPLTFDDGFQPRVRALALAGNRSAQGEAGVGVALNKTKFAPLVAAGVQLPYVNGGANYVYGGGLKPYLGVNTLQRVAGPARTGGELSCTTGTLHDAVAGDPTANIVNGKICY